MFGVSGGLRSFSLRGVRGPLAGCGVLWVASGPFWASSAASAKGPPGASGASGPQSDGPKPRRPRSLGLGLLII